MSATPTAFPRRSPVHRRLTAAGLRFVSAGDAALAHAAAPLRTASLSLSDLSVLPRWGVKGRAALAWLAAQGAAVPDREQSAVRQRDGALIARLSPGEALVLPALATGRASIGAAIDALPDAGADHCYPVPRRDSHGWFLLRGPQASALFARLCAVDLAADRFPDGAVAQTEVARLAAIVIRNDLAGALAFSLLADSASAEYLWDCLLDAMDDMGGIIAGAEQIGWAPHSTSNS